MSGARRDRRGGRGRRRAGRRQSEAGSSVLELRWEPLDGKEPEPARPPWCYARLPCRPLTRPAAAVGVRREPDPDGRSPPSRRACAAPHPLRSQYVAALLPPGAAASATGTGLRDYFPASPPALLSAPPLAPSAQLATAAHDVAWLRRAVPSANVIRLVGLYWNDEVQSLSACLTRMLAESSSTSPADL